MPELCKSSGLVPETLAVKMKNLWLWLTLVVTSVALLSACTPAIVADDLTLELISVTTPAQPGSDIEVVVRTLPGATCTLYSIIPQTGSRSRYPERRTLEADSEGRAKWVWPLHRFTREGDGYLEITVEFNDRALTRTFLYRVEK
jgi:hypothetical protein